MADIDEKTKSLIDGLSKEEMTLECNKGRRSRFQNEGFAYMQSRLEILKDEEISTQQNIENENSIQSIELAREANSISGRAYLLSKRSCWISFGSFAISLLALGVAVYSLVSAGGQP